MNITEDRFISFIIIDNLGYELLNLIDSETGKPVFCTR